MMTEPCKPFRGLRPSRRHGAAWLPCAVLATSGAARAQELPAPRPLAHSDFDAWRTIATPVLSRNGQWLVSSVQPQAGDGELVVREQASGHERRAAVGMLPPPATAPIEENPDAPPVPRAIRVVFSSDSRYLVASTYPSLAETLAARKARSKAEDGPMGGLLYVPLQGGEVKRVHGSRACSCRPRVAPGWPT